MAWLHTLASLAAALVIGAAIGWERETRGRPAGLRTHMLIGLGAAVIVAMVADGAPGDVGRAIQGVAAGLGFICAGEILHHVRDGEEHVRGLTSAAALWVTAALGMAAALHRWVVVVVGTVATVLTLTLLHRLELRLQRSNPTENAPKTKEHDAVTPS
jgi:putative Mg2+ transporter-C (MgtC) family protein